METRFYWQPSPRPFSTCARTLYQRVCCTRMVMPSWARILSAPCKLAVISTFARSGSQFGVVWRGDQPTSPSPSSRHGFSFGRWRTFFSLCFCIVHHVAASRTFDLLLQNRLSIRAWLCGPIAYEGIATNYTITMMVWPLANSSPPGTTSS